MPYARFVREQLAGDVLFPGDPDGIIATGFLAAGPWDFVGHVELREGTVDKEKTRLLDRDDMVANVMSTFASLTVHCARCHDHKFDPIPQKDYYRLQAVFAGVDRGDRPFDEPAAASARRRLRAEARRGRRSARGALGAGREPASPELARLDDALKTLRERAGATAATGRRGAQPDQRLPLVDPRRSRTRTAGSRSTSARPCRSTRSACPRPADRLPRHARLRLPGAVPGRGGRRPDVREGRTSSPTRPRPTAATPADEPFVVRPKGVRARYVRVTATRLWKRTERLRLRAGGAGSPLRRQERRGRRAGDGARLDRGRPLEHASSSSTASTADAPGPMPPTPTARVDLIYRHPARPSASGAGSPTR